MNEAKILPCQATVDAADKYIDAHRRENWHTVDIELAFIAGAQHAISAWNKRQVEGGEAKPGDWHYSINYGPDGEANYANVFASDNTLVGNLRTHHAIAIVQQMNARALLSSDTGGDGAKDKRALKTDWVNCPICGEPDMEQITDANGHVLVQCVNHGCESNGAKSRPNDYALGWKDAVEAAAKIAEKHMNISKTLGGDTDIGLHRADKAALILNDIRSLPSPDARSGK